MERARKREAEGAIRQCNEGKLEFRFEETRAAGGGGGGSSSGDIVLEVAVPKYLDSSLIDLDVHPHYVSVVIKGKVCITEQSSFCLPCRKGRTFVRFFRLCFYLELSIAFAPRQWTAIQIIDGKQLSGAHPCCRVKANRTAAAC